MGPRVSLIEQDGSAALIECRIQGHALLLVAEVAYDDHVLRLERVHIEGASPNMIGLKGLYRLACTVMKELADVEQIVVLGGIRTSGAQPGHRPRPLIFRRRQCRSFGLA